MPVRDARAADDAAVSALVHELWATYGLDYRGWSAEVVEARARARAALEGLADLDALRARLLDDPRCLERLIGDLAVSPSGPFADVGFARALRGEIVQRLRTYPSIRVWHAACATGEDVYTTAIVLREAGLLGRTPIYATESTESLVARAQAGVSETSWPAACDRYLAAGGVSTLGEYYQPVGDRLEVRAELRDRVTFAVHSFASDASFNDFHLVVCRGVLRQFGPALRSRAIHVIDGSVVRFGFLALGQGEAGQAGLPRDRFEAVRWVDDLYRKVG